MKARLERAGQRGEQGEVVGVDMTPQQLAVAPMAIGVMLSGLLMFLVFNATPWGLRMVSSRITEVVKSNVVGDVKGGTFYEDLTSLVLFVETVHGDLTIKIEDNTATGEGIYGEPVENKDQTLDDSEIYYAVVGNIIILKIRPYRENNYRYFVYNSKLQEARRIDALEHSCVLLPDGQLKIARTYTFEFSDTGNNRRHGAILMLGGDVLDLHMEPYRVQ